MSPASARVAARRTAAHSSDSRMNCASCDGRGADPRDEGAELGHDLHEALVAQADQRLAHRRAADGEALGELVLGDALAGGELRRR